MTPIVLAAVSALVWGTADFSGGKASQRARPLTVTVVSQLLCLPALLVCVLLVPGTPTGADLAWGAGAGLAGFAGIVLLYRALAAGAMAVVAPVTAVTAAVVPIAAGLLTDRTPGAMALGGAGLAVVAIALVSLGPGAGRSAVTARLIGLSLLAGALFGLFFALLGQSSAEAGMWPLAAGRISSILVGVALLLRSRTPALLPRPVLGWAAVAGTLDILANALYLAAAVRGHLSIVAAIAALYPASTVLLALAVDRERLRPVQLAGLGLAATALVLATT
ncbi:EamA family transporter [Phytohabitans rumicis]|uniref:Multidrug transporter n=1 Tax=Phytohabitans rumicis TaxID=1076125 RepID=A0A6V8LD30_9ACTN|nr:EamA family transporter [Phytohabitans rumicis]GFJ91996.1 multidrug transporter [Phytohabitans rumicis]